MRLSADPAPAGPAITGFRGTLFLIGGTAYRAVLLTPDAAQDWAAPALDTLTISDLEPVLAGPPEFLLLGTGAHMTLPPRALAVALEARGIGLEVMDSRAAARAWTILRAEGRPIAAALLPL